MPLHHVKAHTRKTSSGKVVHVKAHMSHSKKHSAHKAKPSKSHHRR